MKRYCSRGCLNTTDRPTDKNVKFNTIVTSEAWCSPTAGIHLRPGATRTCENKPPMGVLVEAGGGHHAKHITTVRIEMSQRQTGIPIIIYAQCVTSTPTSQVKRGVRQRPESTYGQEPPVLVRTNFPWASWWRPEADTTRSQSTLK